MNFGLLNCLIALLDERKTYKQFPVQGRSIISGKEERMMDWISHVSVLTSKQEELSLFYFRWFLIAGIFTVILLIFVLVTSRRGSSRTV